VCKHVQYSGCQLVDRVTISGVMVNYEKIHVYDTSEVCA
jgi:hypothetical protein